MWWVGISASPCKDAAKMGYDDRQVNRIVIRLAQYCLGRNMCVIFGHDWREDGVMRAVAEFAIKAAAGAGRFEQTSENLDSGQIEDFEKLRMLNVVPTARNCLSRAAVDAQRESGGVLQLLTLNEAVERLNVRNAELASQYFQQNSEEQRAEELTKLRLCITALLDPGCRICLGGKTSGYEGKEPGIVEEARLALKLGQTAISARRFWWSDASFGRKQSIWMHAVLGNRQWSFHIMKGGNYLKPQTLSAHFA